MDTRLDYVAKAIAQGTTRRQALRRLGGGLAAGVLAGRGLGGTSVQAQSAPDCPTCRQCINQFVGECISVCVRSGQPQQICAGACCEGSLTVCTILGECVPTCTATCPPV